MRAIFTTNPNNVYWNRDTCRYPLARTPHCGVYTLSCSGKHTWYDFVFQGFTTYLMKADVEIQNLGFCWRALAFRLPEDVKEKAASMRLLTNKMVII